jgi:transcriptional regulator with XRE-family HTH domain
MRIGETRDVIEAPAGDAVVEIPWDRIRSIADPEFRAHLADQAKKRARRIGGRIRAMRLEAGLTSEALAEKIGVPREVVIDLEAGEVEPRADLIEYIAIALGRRLRDFAAESLSPHQGAPDMTERQQAIFDAVTDEPKTVAEIEAASGGGRPGRGAVRHCLDWLDKVHHLVTKVGERPVRYKRRR